MKQIRRAAALALTALLALNVTACTGGGEGAASVTAAREKLQAVTGMTATYRTEMEYTLGEEHATNVSTMDLTILAAPVLRMQADVAIEMTGMERQKMTMYLVEEGAACTQYLTDGTTWMKSSLEKTDVGEYNVRASLDKYLAAATDFRQTGTEQAAGQDTVKFTGTIAGKPLVDILEQNGALETISTMSADQQEKIRTDLEGLPGLPVTLWVGKESGYPVQYEMDLTKTMDDASAQISKTLGGYKEEGQVVVTGALIRMTCADFNTAADFVLPEGAKNARTVGEEDGNPVN